MNLETNIEKEAISHTNNSLDFIEGFLTGATSDSARDYWKIKFANEKVVSHLAEIEPNILKSHIKYDSIGIIGHCGMDGRIERTLELELMESGRTVVIIGGSGGMDRTLTNKMIEDCEVAIAMQRLNTKPLEFSKSLYDLKSSIASMETTRPYDRRAMSNSSYKKKRRK